MESIRPVMMAMSAEGIRADIDAALTHLASLGHSGTRVGVVGFCMGGSVTLVAAVDHALGAAVTFYGGGVTQGRFGFEPLVDQAPRLRTPWLGLFGDLDQGIPVDDVEALRAAAATAAVETEVVRYPEAGHGFNCDDRDAYHQPSATDAWARTWTGSPPPALSGPRSLGPIPGAGSAAQGLRVLELPVDELDELEDCALIWVWRLLMTGNEHTLAGLLPVVRQMAAVMPLAAPMAPLATALDGSFMAAAIWSHVLPWSTPTSKVAPEIRYSPLK